MEIYKYEMDYSSLTLFCQSITSKLLTIFTEIMFSRLLLQILFFFVRKRIWGRNENKLCVVDQDLYCVNRLRTLGHQLRLYFKGLIQELEKRHDLLSEWRLPTVLIKIEYPSYKLKVMSHNYAYNYIS